MADQNNKVNILISAKDAASGVLGNLKGQLMALAGIIAAYFGIDAYRGAVNSASEFEAAMSRVKAATGATADEMAALKKAAEDAAAGSSYSAVESAGALENLAKAGLSAKDAIATLPAVFALAQAGDVGLADSADYISKAIQGMGLQFSEVARVADVLSMGANASSTNVKGLAEALSYSAPVAKSLGVSLESTVAMIGQFANAGIDASRAGTALNSIMSQFSDPGSKFRTELSAAGITTNNFEDALHQLANAGNIGGKAMLAVGQEAGPALVGLLNKGMPALDELKGKLIDSAGSAQKFAEVMKNNLSGSMGGLASAWEAVQLKLGTPVLPVLKDAVDQLAGALKAAVADGTAQSFGDAIAAAFQSCIKWAKDFVAQINFTQVAADLRAFADRAGEVFTKIGEYASTAGNSAKLAYGVMSAGANTVLGIVYLVGEAFAGVASNIQAGMALIMDGYAKITFGKLSDDYKTAAETIRHSSEATWAASEALAKKSQDAFDSAAKGAEIASEGWSGLTDSTATASKQASVGAQAFKQVAETLKNVGAEAAASGQKTAAVAVEQKQATDTASAAVSKLRDEYKALVANGDLQGAAEKIKEINKALQATPPASKDAAEKAKQAAKDIADAFAGLGVTSQAELKRAADSQRIYFERIKNDANSTKVDISNAFKGAADAAIKANNGVAPSWVTAQAAARGYEVQVDSAGKATLAAAGQGVQAVNQLASAFALSAEQIKANEEAMDRLMMKYTLSSAYSERQIELLEKENALAEKRNELENKRLNRDANGFSLDKTGKQTVNQGVETWMSIKDTLKNYGVDEEAARKLAYEFTPDGGKIAPYSASAAQKRYGGEFGTLGFAIQQAAQQYLQANPPSTAQQTTQAAISTPTPTLHTVNISIGGASKSVQTDAAGADTLKQILQQLAEARGTAS